MRTQVGIVGGGPSGLLLARLLGLAGIETIVLERRTPEYLHARIRAGLLEQGTVDLLKEIGVGDRLNRERLLHDGVELAFDGKRRRIDLKALSGKSVTIYGQAEIQRDLMDAHEATGRPIIYEAEDVSLHGLTGQAPRLHYTKSGESYDISCDVVAGCDGFRHRQPRGHPGNDPHLREGLSVRLAGILSETPPVNHELIYSNHERGFALCTMRSLTRSRYYLQGPGRRRIRRLVRRSRFWSELKRRLPSDVAAASLPARRSRRAWRRCAHSWPSRCATAGCSWPAMLRISCPRPGPRASTWRRPTCASWPRP
jgi:p-hydroxybenzoate 3-monooxygenase